jgi:uncharacterized repeat protein (TIGR01451 family)
VLALFLLVNAAPALADRAFTTRFSANDTGNITTAANTLMVCPAVAPGCTAARTTPPIASGSNAAIDNNGYNMTYVNTAPGTVAGSATFDSSSATLSLPPTATVLFAGLYWGADTSAGALQSGGGPTPAVAPGCVGLTPPTCPLRGQVGFKAPGDAAYRTLTGSVDQSLTQATRYGAFADVTSIVQSAGAGTYSVANVQAGTGGDRYAGWTLVVAYRDSTQPPRNLTVDDGFVTIDSSSPPTTIPITGFRTPPSGPVRTTLGFVSYEGDAGLTGDSASLNGTTLSDGASPPNNFFDAQISNLGTNVTTRNPNDTNNWDYDSKQVSANGILPNNATSANIVVTTNGDTYYPAVVTLATDLYAPNITSSKSVTNITHPGGPDQRGDTLRYTVSYTNSGQDPATNFVMRDPIPAGTTYVPGSLHITAGPQAGTNPTDALGDDAGEFNSSTGEVVFRLGAGGNATTGGAIAAAGAPGATVTATFDVRINSGAAPGQQIVNQATATFLGQTLGIPFTDTSPRTTNTVAAPALTIAKSHTGGFVGGEATTFTLAVSNAGNLATDGSTVTVTDPFPASSFSALANAGGDGWNCSIADLTLTLTCTRSDALAAGASYPPILVDATVQESTPATVANTATVAGGGSAPSTGSDGGGASGLADLSITKTVQPAVVPNGGQVTYALNVQNAGPSAAQDVTVSDPVDTGSFRNVAAQSTQGTCDATVSCSLGTVDANSTVTITITATVTARDTTLLNTATVSSPTPDPHLANNTASASVLVPGSADLSVAKTGSLGPIEGGADSYTITVTNHGPDPATGVVVNDPLPPQFTATGATGATCSPLPTTGGTLVCTLGTMAANDTVTITITGTLGPTTGGQTVVNAATVSSNTADPDLSNNTATFNQLVSPAADLTITKHALLSDHATAVTNPLAVGDTFDYQIGVTNHGPSPADTVQVTDTLPAGITLVTPVPSGCTESGATVTCTIGTLPNGESRTLNLNVHVDPAAAHSAPQNFATVTSTTPDPNPTGSTTATTTVGVGDVANLSIHKSVSPTTANVGDLVTYTYSVTNDIPIGEAGGAPAGLATTGAVVTDPLPAGVQFVAAGPSSPCTATSGTVTCHLGPVAQGQVVTASFTARVTVAGAGTSVTNRATVATEAAGGFPAVADYNPTDNSDAATVVDAPLADLSLAKAVSNPNPAVDAEVVYTLTAHNAGPNDATGINITDSLPAGLDFIDASPGCANSGGNVTCDIGLLPSGADASVTIGARTTAALAGTAVGNLATVLGHEFDSNLANNNATATIDVQPLVDLRLTKVASNPTPAAGGPVTYTLSLANNGPSPATGVTITDPLPSGLSFVSATAGQGSCAASGQTVRCQLGTIAAGGATVVTITAHIAASAVGVTLANTATASANEPVARPELLRSEASITPTRPAPTEADLVLTKTANQAIAHTGEKLTYTITVTNHGPATAASPTVTDAFSQHVKIVSVHTSSGTCKHNHTLTCHLASIPSGASDKITIVVKPTVTGHLRNTASVASPTPDSNPSNNTAHVTTNVRPGPAALRLAKTASRRTVASGQAFSFTIAVHSLGPEPALGVQVCDRLGSGMAFISVDHATFRHGSACWKISSLAKGKMRRFVVKVRALAVVSGGRRLTNVATAKADGVRTRTARASVTVAAPPPVPVGVTG